MHVLRASSVRCTRCRITTMACMSHSMAERRQRHKAEGEGSSVPRSRMRHIRKPSEGQSGGESRGAGGARGHLCPGNIIDGIAV
jgi:hypothetical protein